MTALSAQSAASISTISGKYRVLAQLGQGGTADVSLAVARGPQGFNKLVVLKSMRPSFRDEPGFVDMFLVEARLAAQLNHPNIAQVNEVFHFDGLPVIVMEYLEGQTLAAVVASARRGGDFHSLMHLRVLSECLSALDYAHNLSDFQARPLDLVHRDVTPHNIFVTYDGQVKLLDFGIAKINSSQVDTATGILKGKVRYMSPEQISGIPLDRRADLYAIGVMMWEAATGKRLWNRSTEADIMNSVLAGDIISPRSVNPDVPVQLDKIIVKAMAVDRELRYASAQELQQDLDDYLNDAGSILRARDIGQVVSEMFQITREQDRKAISTQLAKVVALGPEDEAALMPIDLGIMDEYTEHSQSRSITHTHTVITQSSPRFTLVAAFIGAVLGASALIYFQNQRTRETRLLVAAQQPVTESDAVNIRITGFPATATLTLDGKTLPSNPYQRQHQKDGETHELTVSAPGYKSETRTVSLQNELDLVVTLSALPAEKKASAPSPKPAPASSPIYVTQPAAAAPAPAAPPQASNCDTPYYIDSQGIKKYKTECL